MLAKDLNVICNTTETKLLYAIYEVLIDINSKLTPKEAALNDNKSKGKETKSNNAKV